MLKKILIVAAVWSASVSVCMAQSVEQDRRYMVESSAAYKAASADLLKSYARLLKRSPLATRPILKRAQQDWTRFIENDCKFQLANMKPANSYVAQDIGYTCKTRYMRDRRDEFERQIACPGIEGEVTCRPK